MTAMIEIPMFRADEALVVQEILERHGIGFRTEILHLGATRTGGRQAYTFWVPEARFADAIELLKECFQLRSGKEDVSGVCPACGTAVESARRCPDCDLNLSGDYSGLATGHPFVMFLQRRDLL